MENLDKQIKIIEQGEAWEEGDEVVQVEFKKPLDEVIPVRLSAEKWEELRKEARELGVGPTTLARMWILERLRKQAKENIIDIATIDERRGEPSRPYSEYLAGREQ